MMDIRGAELSKVALPWAMQCLVFLCPSSRALSAPPRPELPWAFATPQPPFEVISSLCPARPLADSPARLWVWRAQPQRPGRGLQGGAGPRRARCPPAARTPPRGCDSPVCDRRSPSSKCRSLQGSRKPRSLVLLSRGFRDSCLGANCCVRWLAEQKPRSTALGLAAV